jgi:hypothetical protein
MNRLHCGLVELKLAPSSETELMTFSGYGAVFNNIDSYGDMIMPGAFADYLSRSKESGEWPAMLLQHGGFLGGAEDESPIGIWTELAEDGTGLKVAGKLAETQRGRDAYTLLKMDPRPAITGLSIGYIPKEWEPRSKPDDPRRKLKKIDLMEISLVTFPANPKARVASVKSVRDLERILRDGGLSEREAKTILAKGASALPGLRDGDQGNEQDFSELYALLERNISKMEVR